MKGLGGVVDWLVLLLEQTVGEADRAITGLLRLVPTGGLVLVATNCTIRRQQPGSSYNKSHAARRHVWLPPIAYNPLTERHK